MINADATNPPAAVQVAGVSQWYGDVHALDDVSLAVAPGEMFGLIGPNGAGKSTLFKLMLGLIEPGAGAVRVHGVPTGGAGFRQVRRRIGYLPESFVTYDNLSGLEVLQLFADLKRVPRSTCAALLARVGLDQAGGRRVRGYSKGMRQRLGFAQALLGQPDLIFLDEPTNGLDPQGIHDFYRILRQVQGEGATIIITSHILAEIQERVDRLLILQNGRIAAQGTLAQLRARQVLPSHIELALAPGHEGALRAALAPLAGLDISVAAAGVASANVRIACLPAQKVEVLRRLLALDCGVGDVVIHDVVIREPSLEDLFLGYGGRHVQPH